MHISNQTWLNIIWHESLIILYLRLNTVPMELMALLQATDEPPYKGIKKIEQTNETSQQ